jgi:hypothetical protein
VTSVRWGYDGKPVDDLVSVRVCFGRCALIVIPSCLQKISPCEGKVSRDRVWGGRVASPSSSLSSSSSSNDSGLEGISSPRALAVVRVALQACLLYLHTLNRSLRAQFASCLTASLGKVTPVAHYKNTQDPVGGHECHEHIKLHRLPKASANKLTLVLSTPSLKRAGPAPGFRSTS